MIAKTDNQMNKYGLESYIRINVWADLPVKKEDGATSFQFDVILRDPFRGKTPSHYDLQAFAKYYLWNPFHPILPWGNYPRRMEITYVRERWEFYPTGNDFPEPINDEYYCIPGGDFYRILRRNLLCRNALGDRKLATLKPHDKWIQGANLQHIVVPPLDDLIGGWERSDLVFHDEEITELSDGLSQIDIDTLDIALILWGAHAKKPNDLVIIDVDDILHLRGAKRQQNERGYDKGFSTQQRKTQLDAIQRLGNFRLQPSSGASGTIIETLRRVKVQNPNYPDRMDIKSIEFRPLKSLAEGLLDPTQPKRFVSTKTFQYHPCREVWEKKLSRFLTWVWTEKTNQREKFFSVKRLLEEIDTSTLNRYQKHRLAESINKLEGTLDVLQNDGIIGDWNYVDSRGDRSDKRIRIAMPENLIEHFRANR